MEAEMAIISDGEIGMPDHQVNPNTRENWDKFWGTQPDLLGHQLMGIYELAKLEIVRGARVLDLGGSCGLGSQFLLDAIGDLDITVVELSQVACEAGTRIHPNVKFICSDIEEYCVDEGEYDLIIASQVLEHLDDPIPTIAKYMKALKPGGVFIIGVPHEDELYFWHQHRFTHEFYHHIKQFGRWISFSDDRLGTTKDKHMFIKLVNDL